MEELRFTMDEFKKMIPKHFEHVIHTESNLYEIPTNDKEVFKIYNINNKRLLNKKLKTIKYLYEFNKEEHIEELVLANGLIYIDNLFAGEILPKIDGINTSKILYDKSIDFNKRLEILKKIGIILDKIHKSNPKYNASFTDVHPDNFMVKDDKVYAVDSSSIKLYDSEGVVNFYLSQLGTMNVCKYDIDYAKDIIPSKETDIYCYIMMILKFLSGFDLHVVSFNRYNQYLDKLANNGFDINLINSFRSIYDENIDNIDPLPYIDTLFNIDDKKLSIAKRVFN